jgi:hypothetical protein
MTSLSRWLRLASFLAPGLCAPLALADGLKLDIFQVIPSRGHAPFKVETKGLSPLDVDFTILDSTGRILGPAEGGTIQLVRSPFGRITATWIYQAPATDQDLHLTIRVTARGAGGATDESKITVLGLPRSAEPAAPSAGGAVQPGGALAESLPFTGVPMKVVLEYLGDDPRFIRRNRLPFLDLESRGRFQDGTGHGEPPEVRFDRFGRPDQSATAPFPREPGEPITVGFGMPLVFRMAHGSGEGGSLCSMADPYPGPGAGVTRTELGDAPVAEIALRGQIWSFTVEDLRWDGKAWQDRRGVQSVMVRGLCPLAGAKDLPGFQDGDGHQARCGTILGLAWTPDLGRRDLKQTWGSGTWDGTTNQGFVFTERGANAVRIASMLGSVRTLCGDPAAEGHVDGPGTAARFSQPGRVAVHSSIQEPYRPGANLRAYVADVGNHCIREVNLETGAVRTLQLAHGAVLANPQGIWVDRDSLVVADQGDGLVKRILATGEVQVVAGDARHGHRFTQLRAIASPRVSRVVREYQAFPYYVLDGNALCVIDREHQVRVLAGSVQQAGFADALDARAGVPCLREPSDLACSGRYVYILDSGNHALRRYDRRSGALTTVVGDPAEPSLRWGLLRDGLEDWPVPSTDYAALGETQALAQCGGNPFLGLGTADCLGLLIAPDLHNPSSGLPVIAALPLAAPPQAGEACPLTFTVSPDPGVLAWRPNPDHAYDFEYWVSSAGASEVPRPGRGRFGEPVAVTLAPLGVGENPVRIRCVTLDGYSVATRVVIITAPAEAPASGPAMGGP